MLHERICQTGKVPATTTPTAATQLLDHLERKLHVELSKGFWWRATCTVSYEAGYQKTRRWKRRRQRLMQQINLLRAYLGREELVLPEGWENTNLRFGCGYSPLLTSYIPNMM